MYKMVDKTQEFKGGKGIIPSKDLEINQPKLELKVNKLQNVIKKKNGIDNK